MSYKTIIQYLRDLNEGILLVVGVSVLCILFSGCQFLNEHPEVVEEAEQLGLEAVETFIEKAGHMHNSLEANISCVSLSHSF